MQDLAHTPIMASRIWIALLRGVNVVGRRQVPMQELAATLQRAGLKSVRTYIQSGNVLFQSARGTARSLSTQIAQLVERQFGFAPQVMVISQQQLAEAIAGNPFPQAAQNHKALHLFFLSEEPTDPDLELLTRLQAGREAFALKQGVFYLYTPDGFPDSKIAQKVERALGVHATARNWRTANQLLAMAIQG